MRTIIDLPDEQISALTEICKARGISRAEAVRRAVAEMLGKEKSSGREEAFGAWTRDRGDSAEFVRKIRKEWDE